MKKVLSTALFVCLIAFSFAQPVASKISVVVKAGKFTINKDNVTNGWKLTDATNVLGAKGDRKRVATNTTHTYDDYGIVLFERNENRVGTGVLSEIQFYVGANDSNSVWPKKPFIGKLEIEGLKLSGNTTWNEVKEKLLGFDNFVTQSDSYMPHNYRLAYKGLYYYFKFNDEETSLLKISVGKDGGAF